MALVAACTSPLPESAELKNVQFKCPCIEGFACVKGVCVAATGLGDAAQGGQDAQAEGDATQGDAPQEDAAVDTTGDSGLPGDCTSVEACDDGNPCTSDDCDAELGCLHEVTEEVCDDGDACTEGDVCKDQVCQGTAIAVDSACNDDNPCSDDTCDPKVGCTHVANSADCDDGNPCTVTDFCSGKTCQAGENTCNCQSDDDCAASDDSDLCNGKLYCNKSDPGKPKCEVKPGSVVVCSGAGDGDCAQTDCVPATGKCEKDIAADGKTCDDGSKCTGGDTCSSGICKGANVNCEDGNNCTTDSCVPAVGCVNAANTAVCSDGNSCTSGDACGAGACTGAPVKCDDGKACTVDSCDPVSGCKFTTAATAEICDNADNDCNGATDEGCDDDKDGYCDAAMTVIGTPAVCAKDNGGAAPGKAGSDCADTTAAKSPGVAEVCDNGVDDNCKGGVDEGCGSALPEICNGQDDDGNGKTDDVVCGSGACTCNPNGNGVAVCPSDCTVCPDNGDLAIPIDDAGVKKVVCAHDYPAWWKDSNISPNGLVDKGDGSVFDTLTGLYWQKDGSAAAPAIWATQKAYCDGLVLAGKADWRMPTQFELQSLVDFGKHDCPTAAGVLVGYDCSMALFWSATPVQGETPAAWCASFHDAGGSKVGVTSTIAVRCVR